MAQRNSILVRDDETKEVFITIKFMLTVHKLLQQQQKYFVSRRKEDLVKCKEMEDALRFWIANIAKKHNINLEEKK